MNEFQVIEHSEASLFDNRTLAIHPASTIFGLFTAEERAAMDVQVMVELLTCLGAKAELKGGSLFVEALILLTSSCGASTEVI